MGAKTYPCLRAEAPPALLQEEDHPRLPDAFAEVPSQSAIAVDSADKSAPPLGTPCGNAERTYTWETLQLSQRAARCATDGVPDWFRNWYNDDCRCYELYSITRGLWQVVQNCTGEWYSSARVRQYNDAKQECSSLCSSAKTYPCLRGEAPPAS